MHSLAAHAMPGAAMPWRITTRGEVDAVGRYRFLLLFRFLLVNGTGAALLMAIWMQGWIAPILATDDTRLCLLIVAVFVVGLGLAAEKTLMLSQELNELERGSTAPGTKVGTYLAAIAGRDGQIRSNLAIVPISSDGGIWVYNFSGNAHVILDVMGYFVSRPDDSSTGRIIPLVSPFRAFDTREPAFADQPLPPANAEDWSFSDFAADVKVAGSPVGPQLGLLGNLTAAALGRILACAAETCQVIVLTSDPARYARVPGARVVRVA